MLSLRPFSQRIIAGQLCIPEQNYNLVTLISQKSLKHSSTRIYVRLLGPCFKTGRRNLFYQYSAQQKDKASIYSQKLLTHVKLKNTIICFGLQLAGKVDDRDVHCRHAE